MTPVTIYDRATGNIMSTCTLSDGAPPQEQLGLAPEHGFVLGTFSAQEFWIDNDTPVPLPPKPSPFCNLNPITRQWEDPRTLEQVQTMVWEGMKTLRSQKEAAGFTWDGSVFDSDQISQSRIMGAVQLAGMNPAFEIPWTLEDNTVRVLSASDMQAVGAALGSHVATIFARAQELRAEIYAATTIAAVEAVTWEP